MAAEVADPSEGARRAKGHAIGGGGLRACFPGAFNTIVVAILYAASAREGGVGAIWLRGASLARGVLACGESDTDEGTHIACIVGTCVCVGPRKRSDERFLGRRFFFLSEVSTQGALLCVSLQRAPAR